MTKQELIEVIESVCNEMKEGSKQDKLFIIENCIEALRRLQNV